jgi:hypothetical protein
MTPTQSNLESNSGMMDSLRFLDPHVVRRIEQALCKVGDFGEVRLIVVKGQLRFIQIMQSENVGDPHKPA